MSVAAVVDGAVERRPTWAEFSRWLNQVVTERDGEWCGIPMPLPGLGLVVEDRHPAKARLAEMDRIVNEGRAKPEEDAEGWRIVNSWRGQTKAGAIGRILVLRHDDGRVTWGLDPDAPKRNRFLFGPFETMDAWNLDTECKAIDKLATLLTERMFKAYVLTGSFLETSKRSGLTYFFRRCRPTIVLTPHGRRSDYFQPHGDREVKILTTLCLHPLAYYAGTFGGAMTPTDDVIAHLMLMRGDEHMFWKRANHHHPTVPEAAI